MLTWVWGDGERLETRGDAEACHEWRDAGFVLVSVTVSARGDRETRSESVLVVPRPLDPAPTRSTPIAYDAARDRVWVVNPDSRSVAVLDADPPALIEEIPVAGRPRTLAIDGDVVSVACQEAGEVWLIDAGDRSVIAAVDVGRASAPYGVVADPRGGRVAVSLQAVGQVATLDTAARVEIDRVDVGPDPRGLAMAADGRLLVTRWRADTDAGATVTVVDAADASALSVAHVVPLPPDVGIDSDTNNNGVPSYLNQVLLTPSGERAILPSLKANVVSGALRTGVDLSAETTARAILTVLDFADTSVAPTESPAGRYPFDDLDFASAAVTSSEGGRLYVAFQGAERIQILDAFSFNVAGSIQSVGSAPQGLALSPDGSRLFVQAFLSRSVRVFDVSDAGAGEPPLVAEVSTVAAEPLAAEVLRGKRVFYRSSDPRMSRTSYLSCASCHLDGEGDGLVWDFTQRGEGLRNTIPLKGRAGLGHGALHWSANFDEVQDFEHDIRGGQGGQGFLPDAVFHSGTVDTTLGDPKVGLDADLDALSAYVSSLSGWGTSPFRRSGDAAWGSARSRGEAIFVSAEAGCSTCHSGPEHTDSGFDAPAAPRLHDVGTIAPSSGGRLGGPLTGLDTPTLRGLWKSAPYLHDGSAPTLRAVLVDRNPTDRHGKTSHLSASDIDDLITFLMSLDDDA